MTAMTEPWRREIIARNRVNAAASEYLGWVNRGYLGSPQFVALIRRQYELDKATYESESELDGDEWSPFMPFCEWLGTMIAVFPRGAKGQEVA